LWLFFNGHLNTQPGWDGPSERNQSRLPSFFCTGAKATASTLPARRPCCCGSRFPPVMRWATRARTQWGESSCANATPTPVPGLGERRWREVEYEPAPDRSGRKPMPHSGTISDACRISFRFSKWRWNQHSGANTCWWNRGLLLRYRRLIAASKGRQARTSAVAPALPHLRSGFGVLLDRAATRENWLGPRTSETPLAWLRRISLHKDVAAGLDRYCAALQIAFDRPGSLRHASRLAFKCSVACGVVTEMTRSHSDLLVSITWQDSRWWRLTKVVSRK